MLSVNVSVGILASSITLCTAALAGTCISLEYAGRNVSFPSFMDCNRRISPHRYFSLIHQRQSLYVTVIWGAGSSQRSSSTNLKLCLLFPPSV